MYVSIYVNLRPNVISERVELQAAMLPHTPPKPTAMGATSFAVIAALLLCCTPENVRADQQATNSNTANSANDSSATMVPATKAKGTKCNANRGKMRMGMNAATNTFTIENMLANEVIPVSIKGVLLVDGHNVVDETTACLDQVADLQTKVTGLAENVKEVLAALAVSKANEVRGACRQHHAVVL